MNAFLRSLMPLNHVLPSFVGRVSAETVEDLMCRPKSKQCMCRNVDQKGIHSRRRPEDVKVPASEPGL